MKYFSTFSGIGGFELGIEKAYENFNRRIVSEQTAKDLPRNSANNKRLRKRRKQNAVCVGYSEIDKYATEIYQKHFPKHKAYGDITKINEKELPDFDVFVGGFPCQSFSIAGKRGGFQDTRGTMFFEIARILKCKKPKLLVLENVKGLLSHDEGRTFRTIITTLDELGYDIQWQVLNSKNHGVPHNRERVFIIGHLRGSTRPEVFPFSGTGKEADGKCISSTALDANYWKGIDNHGQRTAIVHGDAVRRLTPLECERLQSFPDGWTEGVSDTQRYKCLGNAVTVNVIQDIFSKLI